MQYCSAWKIPMQTWHLFRNLYHTSWNSYYILCAPILGTGCSHLRAQGRWAVLSTCLWSSRSTAPFTFSMYGGKEQNTKDQQPWIWAWWTLLALVLCILVLELTRWAQWTVTDYAPCALTCDFTATALRPTCQHYWNHVVLIDNTSGTEFNILNPSKCVIIIKLNI